MRIPTLAALCLATAAAATAAGAEDTELGVELYQSFCSSCHGETGIGDGPVAGILNVTPTDLTQLSAANGGAFPVVRVVRQIDGRDPDLKHGGIMPLFGEYFDAQDTAIPSEDGQPILTSAPIAELVLYLKGIQG